MPFPLGSTHPQVKLLMTEITTTGFSLARVGGYVYRLLDWGDQPCTTPLSKPVVSVAFYETLRKQDCA